MHKTGLGSSAALTTSLITSLLQYYGVVDLSASQERLLVLSGADGSQQYAVTQRMLIHNLAQVAHSLSQGKIGSGFDISAAVYGNRSVTLCFFCYDSMFLGSQVYQRFSPHILDIVLSIQQEAMLTGATAHPVAAPVTSHALFDIVMDSSLWDQVVSPLPLPPGIDVLMGDVHGGTNSPSMVRDVPRPQLLCDGMSLLQAKAVLNWRKQEREECNAMWKSLGAVNDRIGATLQRLATWAHQHPENYHKALSHCQDSVWSSWAVQEDTNRLSEVSDHCCDRIAAVF